MIDYVKRHLWAAVLLSLIVLAIFWGGHILFWQDTSDYLWYDYLLPPFCVMGVGLVLAFLTSRYALLPERSYWVLVCYVLLVCSFPNTFERSFAFPAALLVALSLPALLSSAFIQGTRKGPFLVSFYITYACMVYFPAGYLLIPLIISLMRLAKAATKDVVAFLAGILCPLILAGFYKWVNGADLLEYIQLRWEQIKTFTPGINFLEGNLSQTLVICVLVVIIVIALLYRILSNESTSIVVARFYEVLFMMLLFSGAIMAFYTEHSHTFLPVLCIPMALLVTSFFAQSKGVIPKIFFTLLVATLVLNFVNSKLLLV